MIAGGDGWSEEQEYICMYNVCMYKKFRKGDRRTGGSGISRAAARRSSSHSDSKSISVLSILYEF